VSAALQPIATALLDAYTPLDRALRDADAFRTLLRNLGWERAFNDDVLGGPPLTGLAAESAELLTSGATIITQIGSATDRDPLVDELFDVIDSLQALVTGLSQIERDDLPDSLNDRELWEGLALDLPEYLIVRYLERYKPVLYGLLRLAGVIEDDGTALEPENGDRHPYVRKVIVWDNLVALIGDPPGHLQRLYGWEAGGTPFDHARLLDELATFVTLAGGRAERLAMRETIVKPFYGSSAPPADARELALPVLRGRVDGAPAEQGVLLAPIPRTPGGSVDGLYVANLTWGSARGTIKLGDDWDLEVIGALDATGVVGAKVRPDGLAWAQTPTEGRLELALVGTPAQPWLLLGAAGGTRLEVGGLRLALAFIGGTAPDVALEARTLPAGDRGGIAFTIDPGSGDSFMGRLLPEPIEADLDLDVSWSARHGFTLSGGAGLTLTIAVDKTLGPITLESIHLALAGDSEGASLGLGVTAAALLPPFSARVDNVGLLLKVQSADEGIAGGLVLSAAPKPPDAVGLDVDIAGVVSGGGFIGHDPAIGRYYGGLSLDFIAVGLDAVVVVDTQLPGDPDGFALFASLSLSFPKLPLGFGFFLSGVGGLVCVNRTLDAEALAGGLKSGAVDAVLFPTDVVADAALIVSQLDSWFPVAEGSAVFGVAATITWGTPKTIVTGQLGVALSFPDLEIAVLGSVELVLPDEELALLELHMDTVGAIDVAEQTVLVAASIYDSTLLDTWSLSGDMALYARMGDDPYFLLSVGGYHPDFEPPAGLPSAVRDLDRMRVEVKISDDIWYALEAYVAVTSNTLQFGAQASLEASMRFLGVTYTVAGHAGFNVLLVLTPFSFSAGFDASVTVTAGSSDRELTSIWVSAHLEGPKPWFATGTASFSFFGIDVPFHVEFGGPTAPQIPARENVLELVVAALADAAAWRGVTPTGADASAVLPAVDEPVADEDDSEKPPLPVRPDAELEALQTVAPLARTLEHYGIYEIDGPDRLDITGVGIGSASEDWDTVVDWFAPAQYDDMNRAEKLAAPSYEQMTAGVRFAAESVTFGSQSRTVTPVYEVKKLEEEQTVKLDDHAFTGELTSALGRGRPLGTRTVSTTRFTLAAPTWSLADATTGTAVGVTGTYHEAIVARRAALAADPAARSAVRVAPTHAVMP
jgi:hypothetical protein